MGKIGGILLGDLPLHSFALIGPGNEAGTERQHIKRNGNLQSKIEDEEAPGASFRVV